MQKPESKICCNCYAAGNKYIGMLQKVLTRDISIISTNKLLKEFSKRRTE